MKSKTLLSLCIAACAASATAQGLREIELGDASKLTDFSSPLLIEVAATPAEDMASKREF